MARSLDLAWVARWDQEARIQWEVLTARCLVAQWITVMVLDVADTEVLVVHLDRDLEDGKKVKTGK